MNKDVRYKIAVQLIGLSILVLIASIFFIIPTIDWGWKRLFDNPGFLIFLVILFAFLGILRIVVRLRPLEAFRQQCLSGGPIDQEVLEKAQRMALLFPVSAALIAPGFIIIGGIVLAINMKIAFHSSLQQLLLLLLMVAGLAFFESIFVFFAAKNSLWPVVESLMLKNPNFLKAAPPVRVSIRTKLMITFVSLGILMAVFVLFGNTLITNEVRAQVSELTAQNAILHKIRLVFIINLAVALVCSILVGLLSSRDLSEPLKRIAKAVEEISRGEGAQRIPIVTEDEIGSLALAINRMTFGILSNLTQTLKRSDSLIQTIREAASSLRNYSWELSSISSEQAGSASQQAVFARDVSSTSVELADSSRSIAASSQKVHELAMDARQSCDEGNKALLSTLEDIRTARDYASNASQVIEQLKTRSGEINAIVDLIEEISTQINLLSVNAALEAVGAGASGRRFKSVAHEVGRLADKTYEAIERVRRVIAEANDYTEKAVAVVKSSSDVSVRGAEKAITLEKSFDAIRIAVEGTVNAGKEIELTTNQQATSIDQMVDSITAIANHARTLEEGSNRLNKNIEELVRLTDRLKEFSAGKIEGIEI